MSNFTPGPWKTGEASWNEEGEVRYTLHGIVEAKAEDARLIAAAPDLLEALNLFVAEYVQLVESGDAGFWDVETEDKVKKARAAIAKAEGLS